MGVFAANYGRRQINLGWIFLLPIQATKIGCKFTEFCNLETFPVWDLQIKFFFWQHIFGREVIIINWMLLFLDKIPYLGNNFSFFHVWKNSPFFCIFHLFNIGKSEAFMKVILFICRRRLSFHRAFLQSFCSSTTRHACKYKISFSHQEVAAGDWVESDKRTLCSCSQLENDSKWAGKDSNRLFS